MEGSQLARATCKISGKFDSVFPQSPLLDLCLKDLDKYVICV